MNMKYLEGAFISQNGLNSARQIIVKDQGIISGRSKDGGIGTILPFEWTAR